MCIPFKDSWGLDASRMSAWKESILLLNLGGRFGTDGHRMHLYRKFASPAAPTKNYQHVIRRADLDAFEKTLVLKFFKNVNIS
jgi:hypothetical protein